MEIIKISLLLFGLCFFSWIQLFNILFFSGLFIYFRWTKDRLLTGTIVEYVIYYIIYFIELLYCFLIIGYHKLKHVYLMNSIIYYLEKLNTKYLELKSRFIFYIIKLIIARINIESVLKSVSNNPNLSSIINKSKLHSKLKTNLNTNLKTNLNTNLNTKQDIDDFLSTISK